MFLLIDIGNTKIKWMLRDDKSIYKQDTFFTEDIDQDYFEFDEKIKKILISNVAGFEKEAILKIKLKKFSCPIEFIKPHKTYKDLLNNYQDATRLGTDRWLSALSVSHDIKKAAVIASVGTAVTIDYVSYDQKNNRHTFEGGVILPGLHLTKNTLSNDTADLKNGEGVFQMPPIDTANAIQSGFILSVLGNIKSFFELVSNQSKDVVIILSGGDAEIIQQHMEEGFRKYVSIKKDLVLEGLFVLAKS
ncbi:COG1521 Pantothenate kinase type III (Bvg accessory factor family protein) [Candidatus Methylopumilus universalis]|uniref:type III pantothenate kinase n=1 Tax=Candidatus Methylopumilus universalis TaxID=2588536 RepID=UPI003BEF12E0